MPRSLDLVNQSAAPGDVVPSADDLFEALHQLMHLYRGHQYRLQHELTHMDGKVLGFFARHPGATQKALGEHSGRDKGQIARLVGGLRERGLLDAVPDEADRRNVRLSLTAEGRALLQALQRQTRRVNEQAVASLSDDERRQLAALLARVRGNLQA